MPEMTGSQLARAVRAVRDDIPIVLMSGYTDETGDDVASELPVLAKPFTRQDLARALQATKRERS